MRYLVKGRVKSGRAGALAKAIADRTLGRGSIAGDEYWYDMQMARIDAKGEAHWVETCFCDSPLEEERPYWEKYFDLLSVKDAHSPRNCRHETGPSFGRAAIAIVRNGSKKTGPNRQIVFAGAQFTHERLRAVTAVVGRARIQDRASSIQDLSQSGADWIRARLGA